MTAARTYSISPLARGHAPFVPTRRTVGTVVLSLAVAVVPTVATAQRGWAPAPVGISDAGETPSGPRVGTDASGNVIAVWHGPHRAARYASASATWSPAVLLPGASPGDSTPELAVDRAGNALAVWVHADGPTVSVIRSARYDVLAGAWTGPVDVGGAYPSWSPRVAADAAGNVFAVWSQGSLPAIRAARFETGTRTWSTVVTLSPSPATWAGPQIMVDSTGNALVTWQRASGAGIVTDAARYAVGTRTWAPASTLFPGSALMAMDPAGDIVALWSAGSLEAQPVFVARYSAAVEAWGPPTVLAQAQLAVVVALAIDPAGNAFAVWSTLGHLDWSRFSTKTRTWSPSARLSDFGGYRIDIGTDVHGNAIAVWEYHDKIATARYSATTGRWEATRPLSDLRQFAFDPKIAVDAGGNATVVWWLEDVPVAIQATRWEATPRAPAITSAKPGTGSVTVSFEPPVTDEPAFAPANYEFSTDDGATWAARVPASTVSPIRIVGLADGMAYPLRIRAVNAAGPGASSGPVAATPVAAPGAPTDLRVRAQAGNTISVGWDVLPGGVTPTAFVLEGGVRPGEVLASVFVGPPGPTNVFTFTAPTGAYYIRLHAVAGAAWSPPSNEVRIFVNVPPAPAAPTHLLGLVNGSTLALSWTPGIGGGAPTGYLLDVSGGLAATVPLPVGEMFTFTGVPEGTYTFSIAAVNETERSASSNVVTLTFAGACSDAPATPTQFAAARSGNTVAVSWDPPATGAAVTGYVLVVTGSHVGNIPTTARTLSASVGAGSYTVSVAAVNPCGTGAATAPVTIVVP